MTNNVSLSLRAGKPINCRIGWLAVCQRLLSPVRIKRRKLGQRGWPFQLAQSMARNQNSRSMNSTPRVEGLRNLHGRAPPQAAFAHDRGPACCYRCRKTGLEAGSEGSQRNKATYKLKGGASGEGVLRESRLYREAKQQVPHAFLNRACFSLASCALGHV